MHESASDSLYYIMTTILIKPRAPIRFGSVAIDLHEGLMFDLAMVSLRSPIEISRNFDILNLVLMII